MARVPVWTNDLWRPRLVCPILWRRRLPGRLGHTKHDLRQAHHATGEIVKRAEARSCTLAELPLAELQAVESGITAEVYGVLDPSRSVASRGSFGGTAPERVREAAAEARKRFLA